MFSSASINNMHIYKHKSTLNSGEEVHLRGRIGVSSPVGCGLKSFSQDSYFDILISYDCSCEHI